MIPPNPHDLTPPQPTAPPGYPRPPHNGTGHPPGVYLPVPVPGERPSALPPALTPKMTPQGLLKGLKRRWGRALVLGLLFALAAGVGAFLVMPRSKYAAQAMLHVSPGPNYIVAPVNTPLDQDFLRMQPIYAKSRFVLTAALKDRDVAALRSVKEKPDPLEWLEKEVRADYSQGQGLLTISMSGDDPHELRTIVHAVTTAYLQEVVFKEHNARQLRINKLEDMARQFEEQLKDRRNALNKLALHAGAKKPEAFAIKQKLALEQRGLAEKDLIRLRHEMLPDRLKKKQLEDQLKQLEQAPVPEELVLQETEKDPFVESCRKEVADIEKTIKSLQPLMRPDAFLKAVQPHRDRQKKLAEEIEKHRLQIRPQVTRALRDILITKAQQELAGLEAQIHFSAEMEKELTETVDQFAKIALDVNANAIQAEDISDKVQATDRLAKRVADDLAAMHAEKTAPPRVHRLEGDNKEGIRIIPPSDQRQKQLMAAALAALGALAAVFFAVSWWEWRAKRIDSVDEVMNGLGMTVFGALPAWRHPRTSRLVGNKPYRDLQYQSLFTESVDATRTMLLHAARQEGLRVVMVTSAVSGEGKTSLSTHLATSLARANRRTLLVDCDLRRPAAHQLFDLPLTPGFSELLRGEVSAADAVKATTVSGLWMITAGRCDDLALQALAQDDVRKVFAQLKEQYEFIVVDSSPVLPVADSLLVGQYVDAVLMSILRDVSRIPMVYTAYQRLHGLGIRMLGAVVSGTREETQGYGYGYGYQYAYGNPPALKDENEDEPAAEPTPTEN